MCIFTGGARAVESVAGTAIFAGARPEGRQVLAYRMTVAAREPVAMVLPLPVPPGSGEDAVRFIDLSGYAELFDHLQRAFPEAIAGAKSLERAVRSPSRAPTLVVHRVGSFEASYVPSRAEFARLDPRFRLSDEVWDALPQLADWGFCVFQLRDVERPGLWARIRGRRPLPHPIHPMAFEFPRRDPAALFFPTVHVHDGAVHPEARFDHVLYVQAPQGRAPTEDGWQPSMGPLSSTASVARSGGVLLEGQPGWRRQIAGMQPNRDVQVTLG